MAPHSPTADPIRRHAQGALYPARVIPAMLGLLAAPFLWRGTSWLAQGLERWAEGDAAAALLLAGGLIASAAGVAVLLVARHVWRHWEQRSSWS